MLRWFQVNAMEGLFGPTLLHRCLRLLQGLDEADDLMRAADPDFANRGPRSYGDALEDFYDKLWPGDAFEDFLHKTFALMTIELVRQKADPQRVEESFLHMNKEMAKSDVETRAGAVLRLQSAQLYPRCFALWAWSRPADGIDRQGPSKMLLGWSLGPLQRQPPAAHHGATGCRTVRLGSRRSRKGKAVHIPGRKIQLGRAMPSSHGWPNRAWACWVLLWQRRLVRRSPLDSSSWCDQGADASTGEGIPGQLACLGWTGSVRPSKSWWQLDLAGTVVVSFLISHLKKHEQLKKEHRKAPHSYTQTQNMLYARWSWTTSSLWRANVEAGRHHSGGVVEARVKMGQSHTMVVISITCFLIEHSFPLLLGLVLQPRDLRLSNVHSTPSNVLSCSFYDYMPNNVRV